MKDPFEAERDELARRLRIVEAERNDLQNKWLSRGELIVELRNEIAMLKQGFPSVSPKEIAECIHFVDMEYRPRSTNPDLADRIRPFQYADCILDTLRCKGMVSEPRRRLTPMERSSIQPRVLSEESANLQSEVESA